MNSSRPIRSWIIMAMAIFITTTSISAADSASNNQPRVVEAAPVWSFSLSEDRAIKLADIEKYHLHGNMAGILPYDDTGVVLYDRIEQKLIFFDPEGRRLWATGQVGGGPEDHREPCELQVLDNGRIALISLWPPTKIILYEGDGDYVGTLPIHGLRDSQRVVYALNNIYAISVHSSFVADDDGVTAFKYSISTIDDSGLFLAQKFIKSATLKKYRKGMVVLEESLWTTPRIEPGPQGTVIIQTDVYTPNVDVYDAGLNLIARIEGNWTPPPQSEIAKQGMLKRTNGAMVASESCRALRHLFTVANNEIWLQKPGRDGDPVFAAFDISGQSLGEVCLTGIMGGTENMALFQDLLLTFEELEDGEGGALRQTFRLYRLR